MPKMDPQMKNNIIIAAVALLVGATASKFLFPTIQEKIVEKQVEVIQKDIVTETKEIVRPDGTKEIITVVTDKSQEKKESLKVTAIAKSNYHVSVAALTPNVKDIYYQIQVEKRVLGDIHVGLLANTNGSYGLSLGYEF